MSSHEQKCPECGSADIVLDMAKGTSICASCGLVIDLQIDLGPEWRAYNSSELQERARAGGPITPLKAEMGLRTQIGKTYLEEPFHFPHKQNTDASLALIIELGNPRLEISDLHLKN